MPTSLLNTTSSNSSTICPGRNLPKSPPSEREGHFEFAFANLVANESYFYDDQRYERRKKEEKRIGGKIVHFYSVLMDVF